MSSICFIGLGNMGGPMAANLVRAGHSVRGFDLSQDCVDRARLDNVEIASSVGQAVDGADCIMTMLPAGRHVVKVWSEIVGHTTKDALLVDCSTIDVDSAKRVHALAQEYKLASVDAPVSGGTVGAKGATLTFMVGAEPQAYERARPLLEVMGRRVVNCGGPGAGQAAKICNNMILGITKIGISEAFVPGERPGLSHQALFDVASTSSGSCWALTTHCPVPRAGADERGEQRLQTGLRDRIDVEGPSARPTGVLSARAHRRRWVRAPRHSMACSRRLATDRKTTPLLSTSYEATKEPPHER